MAESFVKIFKRDCVYRADLWTATALARSMEESEGASTASERACKALGGG